MLRTGHIVTVALAVCGLGLAQDQKPNDPQAAEREKEAKKQQAESRAKYFKGGTELPELVEKLNGERTLPKVTEEKTDTPAVRAAKRAMNAEAERHKLIWSRITAGSFAGGVSYLQLTDCVLGMYSAAAAVWSDPEKLLPFAEAVVVSLMLVEAFNGPRVEHGIEEPQLGPQLLAARCKAEAVVLKLREKAKRSAGDAPKTEPVKGPELKVPDTPAARAAWRAYQEEVKRYQLIQTRIAAGQFSGGGAYLQLTDCVFGRYAAVAMIWDDPDVLLKFAVEVVENLKQTEEFNAPRVERGVEEPQLMPQLLAARLKAEAVVLKLREKVKK